MNGLSLYGLLFLTTKHPKTQLLKTTVIYYCSCICRWAGGVWFRLGLAGGFCFRLRLLDSSASYCATVGWDGMALLHVFLILLGPEVYTRNVLLIVMNMTQDSKQKPTEFLRSRIRSGSYTVTSILIYGTKLVTQVNLKPKGKGNILYSSWRKFKVILQKVWIWEGVKNRALNETATTTTVIVIMITTVNVLSRFWVCRFYLRDCCF